MEFPASSACADPMNTSESVAGQAPPQMALLDFFFPGFSVFSTAFQKYLGIDLNVYIPLVILCGGATFAWRYFSDYLWEKIDVYLMSTVEVRTDDEIYNILMSWVAAQRFAKNSRRFVVNTNLNSRSWFLWRWDEEDEEDNDSADAPSSSADPGPKKKPLAYTPSFGSHTFWYRGHLLLFKRSQNREQASLMMVSEREEISVSCFGRNPWILKELLQEARAEYLKKDSQKTMIYRGSTRAGTTEPSWQRCMARTSRPFSTVILNEKTKKELVADVADYLSPATRRWYSNRGIPWRRGYLLTGPPGTGKSSLSLALAGFFKMRIYIVSLNSISANEENLASLFAELPRRCVVLLEDIDTAGLTHTREEAGTADAAADAKEGSTDTVPGQITTGNGATTNSSRLSLSGLLNILDGVASQEGRVLIMTTNHMEKLDKALIRPGRVDQIVRFTLADEEIVGAIFRAIFAPLEGDENEDQPRSSSSSLESPEVEKALAEQEAARKEEVRARVDALSRDFVGRIPAHEFSPAEIQGFLMKHKRSAENAVAGAAEWVVETRKEKKEKELKAAEEKRKEEAKKKEEAEKKRKEEEEEKKKKQEEEKKKTEAEEKKKAEKERKKHKKHKKSRRSREESESSDSDSESGSEPEAAPVAVTVTVTAAAAENKEESSGVTAPVVVKAEGGGEETSRKRDSGYGTPVEI